MEKSYLNYFTGNNNRILFMIEQDGMRFSEVAKYYNVSPAYILQKYRKAIGEKVKAYATHIAKINNQDYWEVYHSFIDYHDRYGAAKYTPAYIESLYPDCLAAFREGEPGSPFDVTMYNAFENEPPTIWACAEDASVQAGKYDYFPNSRAGLHGVEQFRITLSSLEKKVLRWHEEDGLDYKEIGIRLNTTREKAADIFSSALQVQLRAHTMYLCWLYDLNYDETRENIMRDHKYGHFKKCYQVLKTLYAEHNATYPPTADMIRESNRKRRAADRALAREKRLVRQRLEKT